MSDAITTFLGEARRQKVATVDQRTKIAHVLASMTPTEVAELRGTMSAPAPAEKTAAFGDIFEDRDKSRMRTLRQQLARAESQKDVKPGAVAGGMGGLGALGGGIMGSLAGRSGAKALGGAALGALLGGGTLGGLGYLAGKGAKGDSDRHKAMLSRELELLREDFDRVQKLRGSQKTEAKEKYAHLLKDAGAWDAAARYGLKGLGQLKALLKGGKGVVGGEAAGITRRGMAGMHGKNIARTYGKGSAKAEAAGGGWFKKLMGGGKEALKENPLLAGTAAAGGLGVGVPTTKAIFGGKDDDRG